MEKPRVLYKYRACDKYNSDIIIGHGMFFPRPTVFNDPFDCRIPLVFQGGAEDWVEYLMPRLRTQGVSDEYLREQIRKIITDGKISEFEANEIAQGHAENELENLEVLCLSEPRDDILMWSHYADCHRGVCFGFSTEKWLLLSNKAKPVEYVDVMPTVNALRQDIQEAAQKITLTKFRTWSHEREWRVVRQATPSQMYSFPPQCLCEVIFGCKTTIQDRRRLIAMVHCSQSTPQFFEALPEPGKFNLRIRGITITDAMIREALGEV